MKLKFFRIKLTIIAIIISKIDNLKSLKVIAIIR